MGFEAVKYWARDQMIVRSSTVLVPNGSYIQVFGNDPLRFSVILPRATGLTILYAFAITLPTFGQFCMEVGSNTMIVTEDTIGDLITYPLWAGLIVPAQSFTFTSVSYNPNRKKVMDDWITRYLSNL